MAPQDEVQMKPIALFSLLGLSVCSPLTDNFVRSSSAGQLGCLSSEVVITRLTEEEYGKGSWLATCGDKVYACSAVVNSYARTSDVRCSPRESK